MFLVGKACCDAGLETAVLRRAKEAEQGGCEGHCMAKQDSFPRAWASMSQGKEPRLDKHFGLSVLQTAALPYQQHITCVALAVVDLFLLFPLPRDRKDTWGPLSEEPGIRLTRRSHFSHPLQTQAGSRLEQSLQGKGPADSSAAVMGTSAALCCQKRCADWCSGSLCHSQVQANEVKLYGNSRNTE